MTKKKGIIIAIVIFIIILSLAISIYMPNKEKIKEDSTTDAYYLLKREEKYGVININGDIIIEPQYDKIVIPNQHKALFICNNENSRKILNDKNEEILKKYENIQPIALSNAVIENSYEKNVLRYKADGKYGLITYEGKIIVKAKYDEISSLGYRENQILIRENGKYGLINNEGTQIIKPIYDTIQSDEYYSIENDYKKSGYIVCNTTSEGYRYGYYDYEANKILDAEYNKIERLEVQNTNDIYLIAAKNGQYGVFVNNNKIINTQYQSIDFNENAQLFTVERTGKFGVLNNKGSEILKAEYDEVQIEGIYIYTKKGEETKVFDKSGKEVDIDSNKAIEATQNSKYYIEKENNTYNILNEQFEKISKTGYSYLELLFDKYFIATNEQGKTGVIDSEENIIIEFKYSMIQVITSKNAVQAIDFDTGEVEIYNNKLEKTIGMKDMSIVNVNKYIKVYNEEEEKYLHEDGNVIEDEKTLEEIKKETAVMKIKDFKRVTYGSEQYYYVEEN